MAHKKRGIRRKHVPQRTCIACRKIAGKRALISLVRTENGVEIDSTGKKAGRGAYLHPVQDCWNLIFEGNRLAGTMRTKLSAENRAELIKFAETLPKSVEPSEDEDLSEEDLTGGAQKDVLPPA